MDSSDAFEALPAPVRGATGSRRIRVVVAVGVVVFVLLALAGLLPRLHLWRRLDQQAQVEKTKAPAVRVTVPLKTRPGCSRNVMSADCPTCTSKA